MQFHQILLRYTTTSATSTTARANSCTRRNISVTISTTIANSTSKSSSLSSSATLSSPVLLHTVQHSPQYHQRNYYFQRNHHHQQQKQQRLLLSTTTTNFTSTTGTNTTDTKHNNINDPLYNNEYYNVTNYPPKYALPVITTSTSTSSNSVTASGGANESNIVASGTTTTNTKNNTNISLAKHIEHFFQKNISISYQQNIIITAELLFQSALQQTNIPEWYGPGRIGRDFRSRHAILSFHIWLLHKRLLRDQMHEEVTAAAKIRNQASTTVSVVSSDDDNDDTSSGKYKIVNKDMLFCKDVDVELFNILWDNTTCRIRALNVYELSVNKHLQNVQQYTILHLVQYDHCYTDHMLQNPHERLQYLRHLVANQWLRPKTIDRKNKEYDRKQNNRWYTKTDEHDYVNSNPIDNDEEQEQQYRISIDHIDRIVWYIDTQYQNIMYDLPYQQFIQGQYISWISLPQFANRVVTTTSTTGTTTTTSNNTVPPSSNSVSTTENSDTLVPTSNFIETSESIPCHVDDILPYPWITNITNQGKIYYWNPETRISTWKRPTTATTTATS